MPYRRLPNTDQARIRALKKAIDKEESFNADNNSVISVKTLNEAQNFLTRFEQAHNYYVYCYNNQISSSQKYQPSVKTARLYVSHFIQVLNLAVTRSEIKEEYKAFYGLDPKDYAVPDLANESSIIEWGEKIIKGEKERTRKGGAPIYNPTIAKVTVHYEIFKEGYEQQKHLQWLTSRSLGALAAMREKADQIILDIWNQIEGSFETLPPNHRLNECQNYGVVYYYRTGETKPQ